MIKCIAAVDANMGIGYNGQLLEHISEDMRYFMAMTYGCPIIMGRKTYESLPKRPLPYRDNIVISSNRTDIPAAAGLDIVNMEEALEFIINHARDREDVFIIGGASVYKQLLPYCDVLYLTHIYEEHDNVDSYFPSLDGWLVYTESDVHLHDGIPYQFKMYIRSDD